MADAVSAAVGDAVLDSPRECDAVDVADTRGREGGTLTTTRGDFDADEDTDADRRTLGLPLGLPLRDRLAEEEDAPRVELMLFDKLELLDALTVSFWDTDADTETLAVTDSVPARLRETLPLADADA